MIGFGEVDSCFFVYDGWGETACGSMLFEELNDVILLFILRFFIRCCDIIRSIAAANNVAALVTFVNDDAVVFEQFVCFMKRYSTLTWILYDYKSFEIENGSGLCE